MATPNYDINYDDKRFTEVENEKNEALTDNENLYGGMIKDSEAYYNSQIEASKDWADKQTQIQNEQTEFAIDKIEQQKEQANKDYIKEQSGSYVDWQKQSNQYGANAEKMAAGGLANTGYSESAQVSMYNTYQNRVAVARQTFSQAVLNYDNAIKDARLQNNAALAQIAYEALQKQLELSLAGFQYKNDLVTKMAAQKTTIEQNYYNRYLGVLDQINKENTIKENVRQFEENKALEEAKLVEQKRQFDKTFNAQYGGGAKITGGSSGGSSGGRSSTSAYKEAQSEKIAQKNNKKSNKTQIKTKYYSGDIADNVGGFGYMGKDKNGVAYQPKGVMINGKAYKLKKVGMAHLIFGKDAVNSSGVSIVGQNVWKAGGQTFIWNGSKNRYERVS